MKFLKNPKKNMMLINILYHRASKENDYNDFIDIIYKDLDTGIKHLETIKNPKMEIYFANENVRNYTHNRNFMELCNSYSKCVPFKNLEMEIAKEAGDNYVKMIQECRQNKNMSAIRNIHKYRYVFGSDYEIENWYKIQWMLEYHNDKPKKISKAYLDIEVDSIDVAGFPRDGECPINAITVVDEDSETSHTFLLRNDKNPQIDEFENNIDDFVNECHELFDDSYGRLNYKFYMYDEKNEIGLVNDCFKLINTLKPDFLMIWNADFDLNFFIDRIKNLGYDPKDIMCSRDFEMKQLYYHKDKNNFDVKNKGDYFKASSYTIFNDQMLSYVGLRKGQGELKSYALNAVAREEIGDEKLDYSEDANIKTLPYVDFKKFVLYNIKD